jgi:hypothetical protein
MPSFYKTDGMRRATELRERWEPVTVDGKQRWMIYPGKDTRVVRVLRKIIRGLSSFHGVESQIEESRVWVDVLNYPIPDYLIEGEMFHHREEDILTYWYQSVEEDELRSIWFLKFFDRRTFIATVTALGTVNTGEN